MISMPLQGVLLKHVGPWRAILAALILVLFSQPSQAARAKSSPQKTNEDIQTVQYQSGGATISALMARPNGSGPQPAIVVVHDLAGMSEDLRDSIQKLASEGFVVLAPDLLSREGGSDKVPPEQRARILTRLSPILTVEDVSAGYEYLSKLSDVDPHKISILGFGWGGWRAFRVAEEAPVYKVVVYCGAAPTEGLDRIKSPTLANYAQYDFRVTGNAILTEKALGHKFTYYVYPKTQRSSFYQGTADYDAEASKLAWQRTLNFLKS